MPAEIEARLKHVRIDDDAEDERKEEGLCISFFHGIRKPWSISVDETDRA